jgi:hypothetical protein
MSADESNFRARLLILDGFGHLAIVLQRRRGGVDDDVIVILRDLEALLDTDVVRRAIEQFCAGDERSGLREPGGIPIARDLASA